MEWRRGWLKSGALPFREEASVEIDGDDDDEDEKWKYPFDLRSRDAPCT